MRRYAQELGDEVIWKHVELYVNEWSLDLGSKGREAFVIFERVALSSL
jgi:1,4-dihydroxy-6-naphthoate synthase